MKKQTNSNTKAHLLRGTFYLVLVLAVGVVVALSSAINLPNHPPRIPTPQNNTAFGVNGYESRGSAIPRDRTLTFADRVAFQRAIEEVYWRHRTWPKENSGAKPSLDKVMPQAQIEKKVDDYLRNSELLEQYWNKPIKPEQLQAEMDRMARQTKQPDVLRELFAALGNDPGAIAECVARPALAERLVRSLYAHDLRFHGELKRRAEIELAAQRTVKQMKETSANYAEVEWDKTGDADARNIDSNPQHADAISLSESQWNESVGKLAATFGAPFGGKALEDAGESGRSNAVRKAYEGIPTGKLSDLQEDDVSYYATAVISKSKDRLRVATVVWMKPPLNGWRAKAAVTLPMTMAARVSAAYKLPSIANATGGCTEDTWTPTFKVVPDARHEHTAVWTGSEMIVWGGYPNVNSGGRYDATTDTWVPTSTTDAPEGRSLHSAVWTGTEMIIWGGSGSSIFGNGGRYNPTSDSWTPTSSANAPDARYQHTAVWTGSEMIIWGGESYDSSSGSNYYPVAAGRYNPTTDTWVASSTTNAPQGRRNSTAVWTGREMIVWGGYGYDPNTSTFYCLNTGGVYNPLSDSWNATNSSNAPDSRSWHTAVWTGSEMIVWGGTCYPSDFNSGARYNPIADTWIPTSSTNAPQARLDHTAVWTGSEMIVWGGGDSNNNRFNTGSRYNPSSDSWTAISTSGAPGPRILHTAVWTGNEMIIWGGGGVGIFRTGGRYDPSTDSWSPTSTVDPGARYLHTAVWTGTEMIILGGFTNDNEGNTTGFKYDPVTDSWSPTSNTNAPDPRRSHTAVWTGSEMIVWGGLRCDNVFCGRLNSGGRYSPSTDTWIATSTTNAPDARDSHTALWTGSEMIVWGGFLYANSAQYLNTGGRYNPVTDSWTATTTTSAPDGRENHTAVWSGDEMIVWGGVNFQTSSNYWNTGGRYSPVTDSWIATSTANAPSGREYHTAVWTGDQMIVWGGDLYDTAPHYLSTGGRYNPATDSWTPTTSTDAPEARTSHSAIWTGTEMIIWGGYYQLGNNSVFLNTGSKYDPSADNWSATSTSNAPEGRELHTAVWTGSEMIVWGGQGPNGMLGTGGRYCAGAPNPTPTPTPPIQVTVQTNPTGLSFTVDGNTYTTTQMFSWVPGSSHTIATTSPQSGGTGVRYVWKNWSGGGAISHTVVPTTNKTYTANFGMQYFLTMTHGTGGTVKPGSGWRNSAAAVSISATPANGYSFSNWTGSGAGSYSGTDNPASITMNGPITENASFTQNNVQVTVQTNPAGLSFSVDDTPYTSAQTFSWVPGSSHSIATTSPQDGGTGVRFVWKNWSGGGTISHTVAPTTNKTYTANFNTQYFLTMSHGIGGSVKPTSGWKASGSAVSISAVPARGYSLTNWSGSGTGSYSGSNTPASITMGGPITEMATFTHN